ncbi:MAG: hypothetical protein V7K40_33135 [Nostoc sp.]|uniref:hypothetical protein n=1 Tax=Nostoc sp. TaxID=1180 RepID=UPI002FFA33FC
MVEFSLRMKEYFFKGIEMEPMTLSFGVMLGFLTRAIAEIKDPRLASNATRYSIKNTVLEAFSVFFIQYESFLEHQRQMHNRCG